MAAKISIHALREEGDIPDTEKTVPQGNFYPRPPRGGRLASNIEVEILRRISIHALREEGDIGVPGASMFKPISIHALREEGDLSIVMAAEMKRTIFLSTPSARRATAKTETKSLFSNKLYNILHEFRRALIYNESKNYPNHAK